MDSFLLSGILGFVEGLTEFLPVSSTGHLVIASHFLDFTGERAATFNVVIQVGAILAVLVLYFQKFLAMLVPSRSKSTLSGIHGIFLLILTSLPASTLGLALHHQIKALFTPANVALSLFVGAVFMCAVEYFLARKPRNHGEAGLDDITAKQALGIGCFQCLALWPGFSRSASTIIGGMLLGLSRKSAAEYSFIAAVPIIVGAAGYDLLKSLSLFNANDIPFFLVGSLAAFVSAWFAIKTFIRLLGRTTLVPFAIYRLFLIIPVYYFMVE